MQRDLVERARRGDHDAFAVLVRRLDLPAGRRRLAHPPGPRTGQGRRPEALVRAWRDLPTLRTADRFDAWLHRLLVRACIDEARRLRRHRVDVELASIDVAGHRRPLVDRWSTATSSNAASSASSPRMRALIVLHYYLDLPLPEVAGALGIPLGTAKSRLHRASGSCARRSTPMPGSGRRSQRVARMSARRDFDGFLSDWLDDKAGRSAPDYADEILARTSATRQRPGGRASKGGSPCKRPFASRPCPGWA